MVKLKLKPDPQGNIILMENFERDSYQQKFAQIEEKYIVNPLLIHAELICSEDSRLKEMAQIVYDKYIEKIAQKYD